MGEAFRRDREADGMNALLNYGYTALRSLCARSVVAAGLHPSLGITMPTGPTPSRWRMTSWNRCGRWWMRWP